MTSSDTDSPIHKDKSELKKKFLKFVADNIVLIICILAIAFILIWAKIKISNVEKNHIAEKEKLAIDFQNSVDSLNDIHIKQVTVVLSWAVRRHLLLDNLEEINLMFASFIKENNVAKIQLINPDNATVLISTDKNEEGQNVDNPEILRANTVAIIKTTGNLTERVVAPIMGLNQMEGVLVVHYYLKNL